VRQGFPVLFAHEQQARSGAMENGSCFSPKYAAYMGQDNARM
jgi:hypothetical protein